MGYYQQRSGGATPVGEKTKFLDDYYAANPDERAELMETLESMVASQCYAFKGAGRGPRPFLEHNGVKCRFSIRTLLYYALHGTVEMTMPINTCESGCYNPHHSLCNRAGAVNGAAKPVAVPRSPFNILSLRKHVEATNEQRASA